MATLPSGMVAWWDASTVTGLAESAQVTSWSDSSGNGYTATGAGGTKPLMRNGFINGNNAIEFSGSNSFTSTLTASQNVFTIFMVAAPSSLSGNRNVIGSSGNGGREFRYAGATRQIVVRSILASTATPSGFNAVANQFEIVTGEWDATTGKIYVNGVNVMTAAFAPSITAGLTTIIGGGTAGMSGKIAEIIVYHTKLSDKNRALAHTYLADKYGINVADRVNESAPVDVLPVSGAAAWYNARRLATQTNGYYASTWFDDSGNERHSAATTGHPVLATGEVNGLSAVYFNTSGSGLLAPGLSASEPDFTIFFVMKPDNLTGVKFPLDSSANGGRSIRYNNSNLRIDNKGSSVLMQYTTPSSSVYQITTFSYASTASAGSQYVDGTSVATTTTSNSFTSALTSMIGSGTVGLKIAEVIVYHSVLSTNNRAKVHSYLSDKYGITVSDYVAGGGQIKTYNGSSFVAKPVKVWNGSSWVAKPLKRWNGTSWVLTNY